MKTFSSTAQLTPETYLFCVAKGVTFDRINFNVRYLIKYLSDLKKKKIIIFKRSLCKKNCDYCVKIRYYRAYLEYFKEKHKQKGPPQFASIY